MLAKHDYISRSEVKPINNDYYTVEVFDGVTWPLIVAKGSPYSYSTSD